MNTAMQDAIDYVQLAREGEAESDLRTIIYNLKNLLEKEKQQIIDAHKSGREMELVVIDELNEKYSVDYYNQTYKTK